MANKIKLKNSSVAAKVPLTTDLDYGELALNYTDGKLYFKNASNVIKSFTIDDAVVTLTGTQTLTNKTLTSPTINSGALSGTFSGAITLSDTTASTSTTTGALKIGGGLGVAGTIYADQIRLTNNGGGTNVYIGDDVVLGDVNAANTLGLRGLQDAANAYIVFGNANTTNYIGRTGSNPLQVTGQFKVDSGTVTGTNAVAMQIAGYANKGGTGYHDFLSVTNGYSTATNASKFFRLNSTGALEIINNAYTTNIFSLTDSGVLAVPQISAGGSTGTSGQILSSTGTGLQWISSTGTVTSVGLSLPSIFTVSGSPVTTSGTLTATLASQTANTFLAAPNGSAGAPTMRAIVAADIPTLNQNTTGSAATLTTARTINGVSFNGSGNITITANTTNALTIGTGLSGTSFNGGSAVTIAIDSTVTTLTGTQTLTNKTLTLPTINNIRTGYTTTATAAGSTTLTASSNYYQLFTGTSTQTVVLPVTSTLTTGMGYEIENLSTGNVTVNSSGGNLVATVLPGTTAHVMCIGTALTTAADWDADFTAFSTVTGTGSNVLSNSPTLVTPALGTPSSGNLANCTFPTLNQNTTGSAATLTTTRTLWGQNFNGSANVTGALSSVTTLSMSGQLTNTVATGTAPLVVSSTTKVANLNVEMVDGYHADTANGVNTIAVRDASGEVNATGFAATGGMFEHSNTISANYAINSGNNAISAGPVTVANGVTVTIPTGSTWVIV